MPDITDMHHICVYDCGKQVLNGSFFGDDSKGLEYSGVLGFNATPAQVVMFHQVQNGKSVIKDFKTIQF